MLLDVTLIASRLSGLAEAGKSVSSLQTLVKDKSVPRKNVSQTMAGLLRRNASGTKINGKDGVSEVDEAKAAEEPVDGDGEGAEEDLIADEGIADASNAEEVSRPEETTEVKPEKTSEVKQTDTIVAGVDSGLDIPDAANAQVDGVETNGETAELPEASKGDKNAVGILDPDANSGPAPALPAKAEVDPLSGEDKDLAAPDVPDKS
jgi:vacuolar protein sorting-associated protein 54